MEIRNILLTVISQLSCSSRPNEVGRKVTNSKSRPMYILKTAFGIVCNLNIEHALHSLVPTLRNIIHFHSSLYDIFLDIVTKNHMKGICKFISFYTNLRWRNGIDSTINIICGVIKIRPFTRKGRSQLSTSPLAEFLSHSNMPFPKERLGFMSSHTKVAVNIETASTNILFVHSVATLMDCGGKSLVPLIGRESACDTYVRGTERHGEWVDRFINASTINIKTHFSDDFLIYIFLFFNIECSMKSIHGWR
mmetsp:Transcript_29642/g.45319  ORF Transcript_29642/g.45319 Transcript_29642/m.45319 type:complete len:250 (-) Transcript_29642:971-1720(-)